MHTCRVCPLPVTLRRWSRGGEAKSTGAAGNHDGSAWQGSAWLGKGLLDLGGSFSFLPSTGAANEQLCDLIQCARVLMRDEDTKRQSLSLHRQRLSVRETDVP